MTWKRVATAVVLIPFVVALVIKGSDFDRVGGAGAGDIAGDV